MDKIILYCDGGCRGNGKKQNVGGWGVYLTYGSYAKELWQMLYEEKKRFKDITFVKVKGHSDNEGNNKADALANRGMDQVNG